VYFILIEDTYYAIINEDFDEEEIEEEEGDFDD